MKLQLTAFPQDGRSFGKDHMQGVWDECKLGTVTDLSLTNCVLDQSTGKVLADWLASPDCKLQRIAVHNIPPLGDSFWSAIAPSLKENRSLKQMAFKPLKEFADAEDAASPHEAILRACLVRMCVLTADGKISVVDMEFKAICSIASRSSFFFVLLSHRTIPISKHMHG